MAKLDLDIIESSPNNKIREDLISLFRSSEKLLSNDNWIKVSEFHNRCRKYLHLNLNNESNKSKVFEVLKKMEEEGLLFLGDDAIIAVTETGMKYFFN